MKLTESYLRSLIKQVINEINEKDIPSNGFPTLPYDAEREARYRREHSATKTSLRARDEIANFIEVYPDLRSVYEELRDRDISDYKILSLLNNEIADPNKKAKLDANRDRRRGLGLADHETLI